MSAPQEPATGGERFVERLVPLSVIDAALATADTAAGDVSALAALHRALQAYRSGEAAATVHEVEWFDDEGDLTGQRLFADAEQAQAYVEQFDAADQARVLSYPVGTRVPLRLRLHQVYWVQSSSQMGVRMWHGDLEEASLSPLVTDVDDDGLSARESASDCTVDVDHERQSLVVSGTDEALVRREAVLAIRRMGGDPRACRCGHLLAEHDAAGACVHATSPQEGSCGQPLPVVDPDARLRLRRRA